MMLFSEDDKLRTILKCIPVLDELMGFGFDLREIVNNRDRIQEISKRKMTDIQSQAIDSFEKKMDSFFEQLMDKYIS